MARGLRAVIGMLVLVLWIGPLAAGPDPLILVMGDSMLASNRIEGQAVADVLEADLGQPVVDRSVAGARFFHAFPITGAAGMRISAQYRAGNWQWVVLNGGGNDIVLGCGCGKCTHLLNRLISPDGRSGAIPKLVKAIRDDGARVIYAGYLRNPGTSTPVKACKPAGDELDRRLAILATIDPGFTFLSMADIVPFGDLSYHGIDRIHPSPKGSRAIGNRIAAEIRP